MAAVVVVVGFLGLRPLLELRAADAAAEQLLERLGDGDVDGARESADAMSAHARDAREHADGGFYRALRGWPVIGDDARAVRDLAVGVERLSALGPLGIEAVGEVRDGLRTPSGGVDLDLVRDLGPTFAEVRDVVADARRGVDAVDPDDLTWPLSSRAGSFQDALDRLALAADGGVTASRVVPALLGAAGPRTYLLVVQNNAEVRSTGGLPGSASLVAVDDGEVELGAQGSANDIVEPDRPVAPFLPGEEETFTDLLVTDFRDTAFTPDFPRAAQLMTRFADLTYPERVDGVVSVDPVTLSRVLEATGPVEVAGRTLSGDTVLRELLLEPYVRYELNEEQDAFFRAAAAAILDQLLEADADEQAGLVTALAEAVGQRRLLFWSRDAAVQEQLEPFPVAGALPRDTGRPEVGFYLDDSTEAKMQYFLRTGTELRSFGCDVDGRQRLRATMTLENTFDLDPDEAPDSVVGPYGNVPRGDMAMQLRVFAPQGGDLTALEVDGEVAEVGRTEVYGRQSNQLRLEISPGEETEVVAELVGPPGQTGDPRLQWTPGMTWGPTQTVAGAGEGC